MQLEPQLIPLGLLVIFPVPLPCLVMVSANGFETLVKVTFTVSDASTPLASVAMAVITLLPMTKLLAVKDQLFVPTAVALAAPLMVYWTLEIPLSSDAIPLTAILVWLILELFVGTAILILGGVLVVAGGQAVSSPTSPSTKTRFGNLFMSSFLIL